MLAQCVMNQCLTLRDDPPSPCDTQVQSNESVHSVNSYKSHMREHGSLRPQRELIVHHRMFPLPPTPTDPSTHSDPAHTHRG